MKFLSRTFFFFMTVAASASSASAYYYVKPSAKETLGSGGYYGTYDYVEAGDDSFYLKPTFSNYRSNTSSGTFNTYSFDAGYHVNEYTIGVTGGFTPNVNSYDNYFVGGKVEWLIDLDKKGFFKRVDLEGSVLQTVHGEQVTTPALKVGSFTVPASTSTVHIQEIDAQGYVAVTMPKGTVSLSLTKSVYDRDVARLSVIAAKVTTLAGYNSTLQGFPDNSATLKGQLEIWDNVAPYVSYSYTSFKAEEPIAVAYTFGTVVRWSSFSLDASYQRFAQKGAADINYYSLGAAMRFE